MLVYCDTPDPRLQYILHFLSQYFQHAFEVTKDRKTFDATGDCSINYSATRIKEGEIWIKPQGLLQQKGIEEIAINCTQHKNNYSIFFAGEGDVGFDLFAAIFYLLSRYEEYLPHQKDIYGRYAFENSLAWKNNFLHLPLINIWLDDFRKLLNEKNSTRNIQHATFNFLPTYDIDIAWSYNNKGFIRNAGGFIKSILKGNISSAKERLQVLTGKTIDPFDAYHWLNELHKKYTFNPIYFFLLAAKNRKYDKNISPLNKAFQQLVQQHAKQYQIGIHPSWQSGDDARLMSKEINTLQNISGKKITASRQHFIRFTMPYSFRQLINEGVTEDYSMGYGSVNGFRASVAAPFYWYDLEKEEETDLLLHPFCFMEANSFFEQKDSAAEALEEMRFFYKTIKSTGGKMITIWHNTFLGCDKNTLEWKKMYATFMEQISKETTSSS